MTAAAIKVGVDDFLAEAKLRPYPREYESLRGLVQHAGEVLSHQFLIRQVWGGRADAQTCASHPPAPPEG